MAAVTAEGATCTVFIQDTAEGDIRAAAEEVEGTTYHAWAWSAYVLLDDFVLPEAEEEPEEEEEEEEEDEDEEELSNKLQAVSAMAAMTFAMVNF